MFITLRKKRAQTTLEYAILIGVIVAGLVGMQAYLKRGYQGKIRSSADSMGEQFSASNTTGSFTTKTNSLSTETTEKGTTKTVFDTNKTEKSGSETVEGAAHEYWFK